VEWEPLSPDQVKGLRGDDLPTYVANGLVGVRVREIPMSIGSPSSMAWWWLGQHRWRRSPSLI
jgi:hypothetical protein